MFTKAYYDRLGYTLPHSDPRFDVRRTIAKRDYLRAAEVAVTGAVAVGKFAYSKMAGKKHSIPLMPRELLDDLAAEMDTCENPAYTPAPAGQPVNETQSVSVSTTMAKSHRRESFVPSSLDRKQSRMTLAKFGKQVRPKSVWSSLRDLVSGKKVLRNNFSFKLESSQDRRGLVAIPLRHDATLGFPDPAAGTYQGWQVGTQAKYDVPGAGGFQPYSTMLLPNNGKTWATGTQPAHNQQGVVIPRLSLPCLEQTSWDLNQLKLVPKNLQDISTTSMSPPLGEHSIVQPVVQLQGSGVPIDASGNPEWNLGIPDAGDSMARKQDQGQMNMFPGKNTITSFPQFKTQLGGGTLKMRVCNQGTNRMTVEFVVLKVVNPYVGTANNQGTPTAPVDGIYSVAAGNCTRIWSQLWRMVGYEHARKVTKNVNFGMGSESKTVPQLMDEPISSPYFPWLSSSLFKAKYPQFWNADGTMPAGNNNLPPTTSTATTVTNSAVGGNTLIYSANPANTLHLGAPPVPIGDDTDTDNMAGQLGQESPYRCVGRGHATIAGAAERTITVPIPGSNYNASRIQGMATNVGPGLQVDDHLTAFMNDESYIVLMSINGSLQDIIEPNALDDSIKVIGKAYTQAKADVYCEYKETVYPSCCDYSDITPVAYNLGSVRGSMIKPSVDAFPGKVLPMAHATPTVGTAVLRTGASERGAPNEGS